MSFWSINRVMVRGVWFDSMPGCNRLLLQKQWVHPFLASALHFPCYIPAHAYLHETMSYHRIV